MSQLDDSVRDPNLAFVGTKFCREWYVPIENFRLKNIIISFRLFLFYFKQQHVVSPRRQGDEKAPLRRKSQFHIRHISNRFI